MIISLDCETTGLDFSRGVQPFFVTIAFEEGLQKYWEWPVDPLTRKVHVVEDDVAEIDQILTDANHIVGQNIKFDVHALHTLPGVNSFPWDKVYDTLTAGHLLASNLPHDLTKMVSQYLGEDIAPLEHQLGKACDSARKTCRHMFPRWMIAKEGLPCMPSAKVTKEGKSDKDKLWKFDMWLPRELWKASPQIRKEHPEYETVLRNYSNADSAYTLALWSVMRQELERRNLWAIYLERLKSLPAAFKMERRGVSISKVKTYQLWADYAQESIRRGKVCVNIAKDYNYKLQMPSGAAPNKSLRTFMLDMMKLEPVQGVKSKTNAPTLDKGAMNHYLATLEERSPEKVFVKTLLGKRKRDTAIGYVNSYIKHWNESAGDVYKLFPSTNSTGTSTLRWTYSNPNLQQVCFDGETELLTRDGWIRVDQLNDGVEVAQYWKETGSINFAKTEIHHPVFQGRMVRLSTEENIDLLLTPHHRCLLRDRKTRRFKDVHAEDFKSDYHHIVAGQYTAGVNGMSEWDVVWLCAVQADGSYHKVGGEQYGITFSFSKPRKIERMRECLKQLDAKYTERGPDAEGRIAFYVHKYDDNVLFAKKTMPDKCFGKWLLDLNNETINLFSEEVMFWDGDWTRGACYSSAERKNVDWVQTIMSLTGTKCTLSHRLPTKESVKEQYYANISRGRDYTLTSNFTSERVDWDGPVYCVTVPSSYVLVRRNGKVAVTGNSKQEVECERCDGEGCDSCNGTGKDLESLRHAFCFGEGREGWSADAKNVELRIPAYEAKELELIALFEKDNEPPYYGSEHLLNFHTIYPDIWEGELGTRCNGCCKGKMVTLETVGPHCKKKFKDTYYQWDKNFDFAVGYGAGDETADRAAHRKGSRRRVLSRFARKEQHNQWCIRFADKHGYIETIPDKTVDPARGYPLMCTRTEWGRSLPTVPLNYRTQGSAMWITCKGMVRCQEQLDKWNEEERLRGLPVPFDGYIMLQIHDEIVFNFPKSKCKPDTSKPRESNLWRVRILQDLLSKCGDDLNVPVPFGLEWHEVSWGDGVAV